MQVGEPGRVTVGHSIEIAGTKCLRVRDPKPGVQLFIGAPSNEELLQVVRFDEASGLWQCALFYRGPVATDGGCVGFGVGRDADEAEAAMKRHMARRIAAATSLARAA